MHNFTPKDIRSTGAGSDKYGVCEVCKQNANTVYLTNIGQWTLFGHEECLIDLRKDNDAAIRSYTAIS